jgi:hypothetical protein
MIDQLSGSIRLLPFQSKKGAAAVYCRGTLCVDSRQGWEAAERLRGARSGWTARTWRSSS